VVTSLAYLEQLLVHEVGHWLGLARTFHGWSPQKPTGGCDPPGDGIDDTPAEASPASGCSAVPPRNTCPGLPGNDPVDNYMDYVNESCARTFTVGQRAAMRAAWFLHRNPGAAPTPKPVAPTQKPVAPTPKPVSVAAPVAMTMKVMVMGMMG
jgi:Pregnancy-associated plasma protein-A